MRIATPQDFNPLGAHDSALICEDLAWMPNNLMPYVAQMTVGKLGKQRRFGGQHEIPDGMGVFYDYVHLADVPRGHLAAPDVLDAQVKA